MCECFASLILARILVKTMRKARCMPQEGFRMMRKARCMLQEGFRMVRKGRCMVQEGFRMFLSTSCNWLVIRCKNDDCYFIRPYMLLRQLFMCRNWNFPIVWLVLRIITAKSIISDRRLSNCH